MCCELKLEDLDDKSKEMFLDILAAIGVHPKSDEELLEYINNKTTLSSMINYEHLAQKCSSVAPS